MGFVNVEETRPELFYTADHFTNLGFYYSE